jgi:hypothetical protein
VVAKLLEVGTRFGFALTVPPRTEEVLGGFTGFVLTLESAAIAESAAAADVFAPSSRDELARGLPATSFAFEAPPNILVQEAKEFPD